jgi:tetratricopeptide (TPR) repeat protein
MLRGAGLEGILLTTTGRYEAALASFEAVIALGRDLGRPVRVLLNYSTIAFREIYDLTEARRRSEEALTQAGRSPNFHMPWMNALVDLLHCDVLDGEIGAAETRWRELWGEVIATPAWERWLLGVKLAAFRAEIALQQSDPAAAAEWAERAIEMARAVRRVKYETEARAILGNALLALGRSQDAIHELRAAVNGADALGSPLARWRTRVHLSRAIEASGNDVQAEGELLAAADIIRSVADDLSGERATRFLAAPPVAAVMKAVD